MVGDQPTQLPWIADTDGPDPIIVHLDMDCFYAACECLRHPDLYGKPVVIGMGYDQEDPHGAVATASYEARESSHTYHFDNRKTGRQRLNEIC